MAHIINIMKQILIIFALLCCQLTAGAQKPIVRQKPQPAAKTTAKSTQSAAATKKSATKKSMPGKAAAAPKNTPSQAARKPATSAKPVGPKLSAPSGSYDGYDYVDLGLPSGTLWATCNVGASKPTEYGYYYAWGETRPKRYYDWDTYFDTSDGGETFYKYNNSVGSTELDFYDDAAYMNWSDAWRMPSDEQMIELREKCIWTWFSKNGVNGYVVESKFNGKTLFLPAAGCRDGGSLDGADTSGKYWSRSLSTSYSSLAYFQYFSSSGFEWRRSYRYIGRSVRPVLIYN